jgi:predicted lipoprotein with Yx(FWY)xxD motif
MTRLLTISAAAIAALTLAACGSSGGSGGGSSGGDTTVSLKQLPGAGTVLVDAQGRALYAADQEAGGKIRCTGACNQFWLPLTVAKGTPSGDAGGTLGVVKRPDGTRQVTLDGKPLYTFSRDTAGKVTGNGFSDAFGGQNFDWKVITSSGSSAPAGSTRGGY